MKKTIFTWIAAICLLFSAVPMASAAGIPAETEVYESIVAMKEEYPEGTRWTNANKYSWNGGGYGQAGGCMAFAYMLSDAAFGELPARKLTNITIDDVRVGDVLRNGWDSHTVIILQVHDDYVVIAEGNWNGAAHWGRELSAAEVAASCYMLTRYPEKYQQSAVSVPATGYDNDYFDVNFILNESVMMSWNASTGFIPGHSCDLGQIAAFCSGS